MHLTHPSPPPSLTPASPLYKLGALLAGIAALLVFASPVMAQEGAAPEKRARALLDAVDDMWRASSSHTTMRMTVKTEHYTRTLEMEAWSKGKNRSLVRILAPRKERGMATLKSDRHVYSYLPRTDRVIRLTSGMMQGAWMGSHFTNDDLVKDSRLVEDYTYAITREGGGELELTLTAKPDAIVQWGKIVLVLDATTKLPRTQRFYDEDLKLARTMTFGGVKAIGGRTIPTIMRLTPSDAPDAYTEVVYLKATFDLPLKDARFSKHNLKD